MQIPAKPTSSK